MALPPHLPPPSFPLPLSHFLAPPASTILWYCAMQVALSPDSLLKNGGRREPGNIQGKVVDFRHHALVDPIRLQNESTYTRDILSTQQKNCQLENELVSLDYTSKVGERQFLDVRKRCKSRESKIKFTCTKCVTELNTTAVASKTRSEIVNSLHCYQV